MVVWNLLYKGRFYVCGCGLGTSLTDCSGRRVHKIDPYMVVWMLLHKGRFYVCGCGLGTSLTDCSGRRVHKIGPYSIRVILLAKYLCANLLEPSHVSYLAVSTAAGILVHEDICRTLCLHPS